MAHCCVMLAVRWDEISSDHLPGQLASPDGQCSSSMSLTRPTDHSSCV